MMAPIRLRQLCTFGTLPCLLGQLVSLSFDFNLPQKRHSYDTGAVLTSENMGFSEVRRRRPQPAAVAPSLA
jgi:hypothetical protein